jgi:hypothetical protein
MPKQLAIVGSRDFPDLELVKQYVARLQPETVVVSGGARGPDTAAADAAYARGMEVYVEHAAWAVDGRGAGFARNARLVKRLRPGDGLLAFWDGVSRGTADVIRRARLAKLWVLVIGVDGTPIA